MFGWPVARLLAIATALACVFWYSDAGQNYHVHWVDSGAEQVASALHTVFEPSQDFNQALERAIRLSIPKWSEVSRDSYKFHVVRSPYPLPDPQAPSFDWQVMEQWCNTIPKWTDYWQSNGRVSDQYREFLAAVDVNAESRTASAKLEQLSLVLFGQKSEKEELIRLHAEGQLGETQYQRRVGNLDRRQADATKEYEQAVRASLRRQPIEQELSVRLRRSEESLLDDQGHVYGTPTCTTIPTIESWIEDSRKSPPSVLAFGASKLKVSADEAAPTGDVVLENTHSVELKAGGHSPGEMLSNVPAQVTLRVQRVDVLPLDRSTWFNQAYIESKAAGPWVVGRQHDFWGRSGSFALLPYALVVWNDPDFPDTKVRWDDDLGGVRWEGGYFRPSSSMRQSS